jgi:predicted metal-dependent phosphoesterase TrpH
MLHDLHLHTLVSDGDLDPVEVLRAAAAYGVGAVAITDHDSLGAYGWRGGVLFDEVKRLGLELTVGIELDASLDGIEVHLLGLGVRLDDETLGGHLQRVKQARWERARREISILNQRFGAGTITEEQVFTPGRETLMKPHFIRPLLERRLFPSYGVANSWYRENVKAGVEVPKPTLAEAIRLVRGASGCPVLAHPGYYENDVGPIDVRLEELVALGLGGLELDYPYHVCSPRRFSREDEQELIARLRLSAEPLGLRLTRGSDCHTTADFRRVYGEPPVA